MKRLGARLVVSVGCAAALAIFLISSAARANGVFPSVDQIVVDPSDAMHWVLRTTFGLVVSRDGGQQWDWVCEEGLGYQNQAPAMAVLPGGYVVLGLATGISVGDAAGCDFHLAAGVEANVTDVSAELAVPGGAIATSVDYNPGSAQVWETTDNGLSWSPLGEPIEQLDAKSIDVVKDNPDRIYLSGVLGDTALHNVLLVSSDHGKSWVTRAVPGSDSQNQPYIAAISPVDGDTVYVRLSGFGGGLLVTTDAGKTFKQALAINGQLEGFAISPDGETLLASSAYVGMYRAKAATLAFERLTCSGTSCLSWTSAGLLGCGNQFVNGFTLGRSADQGESFQPAMSLLCIRGPLACGAATSSAVCSGSWATISDQLGQSRSACDPRAEAKPFQTDCLSSGGSSDAGGAPLAESGAGATGLGTGTGTGGAADAAPETAGNGSNAPAAGGAGKLGSPGNTRPRLLVSGGGCACSTPPPPSPRPWWLGSLVALAVRRFKRRAQASRAASLPQGPRNVRP